jgi:hypothetical protein
MRIAGLGLALLVLMAGCGDGRPAVQPVSTAPAAQESTGPRESIDNPQYRDWANVPKGTTVVHRSVTRIEGNDGETVTTTTYSLLELTPEQAVVEMQTATRRYDGLETKNTPGKFTYPKRLLLPPGTKPAEAKDHGAETVLIGGKEYRTKWYRSMDRNEAGEVFTQVWSAPEVPGGLVKSMMRTPAIGKTTTTELVEIRKP